MIGVVYDRMIAVDTSAVVALLNPNDQFHALAKQFFEDSAGVAWVTLNITTHEIFTRICYDKGSSRGLNGYDFIRGDPFRVLEFEAHDELSARRLLEKYRDQTLSFHDALCGAVMMREGIYRIFTFDRHFWVLGFEVVPGMTGM